MSSILIFARNPHRQFLPTPERMGAPATYHPARPNLWLWRRAGELTGRSRPAGRDCFVNIGPWDVAQTRRRGRLRKRVGRHVRNWEHFLDLAFSLVQKAEINHRVT